MTSDRFSLATEIYQGPLEKLLELIESRKMSVSDVSLAEVTDSYLAYIEHLPEMPLGETAQFILTASTLLLIKSRTLLPTLELSEDERESVEELERRLTQYALVRRASRALRSQWGTQRRMLARRAPMRPFAGTERVFSPVETSLELLKMSAMRLIHSMPTPTALSHAIVAPVLALEDVIRTVHARLSSAIRTRFSDLTSRASDRHEVIVFFLAMLELVRNGSASATQEKIFSDISIELEGITASTGIPRYGT
jgi:segregation and condensation protein A